MVSMSMRGASSVAGKAIALLVAGCVALLLVLTILLPKLGGGAAYTILTGSMRPGMPPGTVVVVRPTPADEIRTGDVITFQLKSGDPTVATHRVAEVGLSLDGKTLFFTKGDANTSPDSRPVTPAQIKGKRWYSVPYVGYPAMWIDGDIRQVVVMGAVGLLLLYSAMSFIGSFRDRRRGENQGEVPISETSQPEPAGVGS